MGSVAMADRKEKTISRLITSISNVAAAKLGRGPHDGFTRTPLVQRQFYPNSIRVARPAYRVLRRARSRGWRRGAGRLDAEWRWRAKEKMGRLQMRPGSYRVTDSSQHENQESNPVRPRRSRVVCGWRNGRSADRYTKPPHEGRAYLLCLGLWGRWRGMGNNSRTNPSTTAKYFRAYRAVRRHWVRMNLPER